MKKTVLWITVVLVLCIFIAGGCGNPANSDNNQIVWKDITVPASTPEAAIDWIYNNAKNGDALTVNLAGGTHLLPAESDFWFDDGRNIKVIFTAASPATISLKSGEKGRIFGVGKNITLVLGNNISLTGISNNISPLVQIWEDAKLEMKEGSKISGNKNTTDDPDGGAVFVWRGHFTMEGGIIENNETAGSGGGVMLVESSTFIMSGGIIKNNKAKNGGGISMWDNANFTMSGNAIVEENTALVWSGGGVAIGNNCTFTMTGGTIRKNESEEGGGGVHIFDHSSFTMTGGTINDNNSVNDGVGGGVKLVENSTFTMSGGTIKNNTTKWGGGGVAIYESTFTMSGSAVIEENEAVIWAGGGVRIDDNSVFTMRGGIIRDNTAQGPGGGVCVGDGTHFTMEGGSINQNKSIVNVGGGLYIENGFFIKTGQSVISANVSDNVCAYANNVHSKNITMDIPAGEDISALWNEDTSDFDFTGTWNP